MPDTSSGAAPAPEPIRDIVKEISDRVEKRYQDAYRVATFIVGVGTAIKALAVVVGILILMAAASANTSSYGGYRNGASSIVELSGFLMAGLVFAIGFIAGVMVSAHGQTLRASLDSAVHSSPFLDLAAKARAMGVQIVASSNLSEGDRKAIADLQKNWPGYS